MASFPKTEVRSSPVVGSGLNNPTVAAIFAQVIGPIRERIAAHKAARLAEGMIPRDLSLDVPYVNGPASLHLGPRLQAELALVVFNALRDAGHRVSWVDVNDDPPHCKAVYVGLWVDNVDPRDSFATNQQRLGKMS